MVKKTISVNPKTGAIHTTWDFKVGEDPEDHATWDNPSLSNSMDECMSEYGKIWPEREKRYKSKKQNLQPASVTP